MIFVKLYPDVRFVFARIASLSFCRLFGSFRPRFKPIAKEIKVAFLRIDDHLLRIELEAGFRRPLLHQAEDSLRPSRMGKRDPRDLATLTPWMTNGADLCEYAPRLNQPNAFWS